MENDTGTIWSYHLSRLGILVLLLILIVVIGYFQIFFPLVVVTFLFAGWIPRLGHLLSEWTISTEQVLWFTGLLLLSAIVLHVLLKQIYLGMLCRQTGSAGTNADVTWKKRWTVSLLFLGLTLVSMSFAVNGLSYVVWDALTTDEELVLINQWGRGSRRNVSKRNLKQIGLAFHNYHDAFSRLPSGGTFDRTGQPQHGWATQLLPFLDQAHLYNQIDFQQPWTAEENRAAFETRLPDLQSSKIKYDYRPGDRSDPDEHRLKPAHYAANAHLLNINAGPNLEEITDGTANTLLAGEVNSRIKAWGDPTNFRDPIQGINADPHGFAGPYIGGAHFLMTDGSVRFISEKIDPTILKALATPAGGEPVGDY